MSALLDRENESDSRPTVRTGLKAKFTAMFFDDTKADGESQARRTVFIRLGNKRIKDLVEEFILDPFPFVRNRDLHSVGMGAH